MNQGGKERTWEPLGTPITNGAERVEQTRALFIVRFLVVAFFAGFAGSHGAMAGGAEL